MLCPHCGINFHQNVFRSIIVTDSIRNSWGTETFQCTDCRQYTINLVYGLISKNSTGQITVLRNADGSDGVSFRTRVHPKTTGRPPVPVEVPKEFAEDYNEACYVLNDSPKASAALSRRCLQNIIHNKLGIKKPNLDQEIQEVLDQNIFPADISESLDQVRAIGNFAAHPIKSKSSGEIVEVEPAEADWNLETLEMIFEFLFVRPAEMQKRKESINQKLSDAGKKPLK